MLPVVYNEKLLNSDHKSLSDRFRLDPGLQIQTPNMPRNANGRIPFFVFIRIPLRLSILVIFSTGLTTAAATTVIVTACYYALHTPILISFCFNLFDAYNSS